MFAVIHLPNFALQSVLRGRPTARRHPAGVIDRSSRQSVVVECNAAARHHLIEPGMTAAQAQARCATIELSPRNPNAEATAARLLLTAAWSLTPRVEVTQPGLCTLDLDGTDQAPAALQAAGQHIRDELAQLYLDGRFGVAATPDLAELVARAAESVTVLAEGHLPHHDFLRQTPLTLLGGTPKLQGILADWGLYTLADFARLPRHEVGQRLGPDGLLWWDRLAGRTHRLLRHAELPPVYREFVELEHVLETLEPLLFLLQRLLEQLCRRLGAAQRVAEAMLLELTQDQGEPYQRRFRVPEPTRDPELLRRLLHAHLENLRLDSAITGLGLRLKPTPERARQRGLFETALKDAWRFEDTLARLNGLVGSARVGSPRLEDTFRPDSFRLEALPREVPPEDANVSAPPLGPALRRYRQPLPVQVIFTDGEPRHLQSELYAGPVADTRGPWRGGGQWWQRDHRWSREEWDVQLESGPCLRVFCDGGAWFVEGLYD